MPEPPKRRRTSRGQCALCGAEFGKAQMTRHLQKHHAEQDSALGVHANRLHLVVEGAYGPEYWLHLDVRADASLKKLDGFLRGLWLECCGHLSAFRIGETTLGMTRKVGQTLSTGMVFSHEYDFGDTTELKLRVLAEHDGTPAPAAILLLARNLPPPLVCEKCGEPAVWNGTDEEGGYRELCEKCGGEEAEEWLLPVVNSPRTGACGYTGPE